MRPQAQVANPQMQIYKQSGTGGRRKPEVPQPNYPMYGQNQAPGTTWQDFRGGPQGPPSMYGGTGNYGGMYGGGMGGGYGGGGMYGGGGGMYGGGYGGGGNDYGGGYDSAPSSSGGGSGGGGGGGSRDLDDEIPF